ncbi:DUF6455 family protein [Pseudothioclava nitratireducens]|uniref:DUF6455 family protein n=1 Tax=Pseudothioclava nitratireducens TaxID=1928646 RepID=UPI0023DC9FE5|nr:DUF6455 family protein [Defluviimonas nitratireducens]MDF1618969.1 DUF6455 family protein [Defluviimonas nitratireducens]
MFGARALNRHAALMNRMAETLGVDLTEAMRRGQFSSEGWRDAVVSCASCDDPTACLHWLADHAADDPDAAPECAAPDYCNNRFLMACLKEAMDSPTLEEGAQ